MFFFFSYGAKQKNLGIVQAILCDVCGQFGKYEAYAIFNEFSMFFIPLYRSKKKYVIKMTCCQTIYELDEEVGRRIERNERASIKEENLKMVKRGKGVTLCPNCQAAVEDHFLFCPTCGQHLHDDHRK